MKLPVSAAFRPVLTVTGAARTRVKGWRRRRAAQGKARKGLTGLLALLLVLLTAFGWALVTVFSSPSGGTKVTLDELTAMARQQRVLTATLLDTDNRLVARVTKGSDSTIPFPDWAVEGRVYADYPASAPLTGDLYRALTASGTHVQVDKQAGKQQLKLVSTFLLPLLILATVFALLLAPGGRKGGAIGGIVDFSTARSGKDRKGSAAGIGFSQAGGVHEAVVELQEVVDYLRNPAKYEALGAAPPKGLLLFGPPGCGKTLLARAVAGEAGVPFFSVSGAEFVEALVGVGAARVRDLFARVRATAPAIVFIDELDAAGRKRGASGSSGGSDEREQTLNQLLVEMDGFDASKGIVVIGATNRPDILDPALRRPGRFDRHITIERPDPEGRLEILKIHGAGKPLAPDVDLERIAQRTPGFTGADLANVVNEAALLTIRDARSEVTRGDLDEAIRRVLEGPKRRGHLMTELEKARAAHHEAGHVVVSVALEESARVQRVSILGGGRAIATTELRSDVDEVLVTETQLRARLVVQMGGPAAERLVYGGISTGVERDLEQATSMARDMVARYGMVPGVGLSRLLGSDSSAYLDDQTPWGDIADSTKAAADQAIRELLMEASDTALLLLEKYRPALDQLATALVEHETLEGVLLHDALAKVRATMTNGTPKKATRTRKTVTV